MDVWPIRLREKLSRLPVPLLPGDNDVVLELQEAFTSVYDLLGYELRVNYVGAVAGTLSVEDEAWVAQRAKGAA